MKTKTSNQETSSFRDPDGFIYLKDGVLYRQINQSYRHNFDFLISSGLYQELVNSKLLIPHTEVTQKTTKGNGYKTIKPQLIPFISYPYEWSFSQLKDAALLTLEVQEIALKYGMILKDASAYNIQYIGYKPVFIDTLSFEKYQEGKPWIAYRQFCQHFLAPLSLMAEKDLRLNLLLREFIDGIPLDLAGKLLPSTTKLNFSLLSHIHLHVLNQKRMSDKKRKPDNYKMTRFQMASLISNLKSTICKLKMKKYRTEWMKYYDSTNYSDTAFKQKQLLYESFLDKVKPKTVLDLGANTGIFSKIACRLGAYTVACDIDPLAVESAYCEAKKNKDSQLLPLVIDLTNPSPALGWANEERKSFSQRMKVDCVSALALIHHLAISNNLPFALIADYLSSLGGYLIVEFIPKDDSKVQILLQSREDIFGDYTKECFEKAFGQFYTIIESQAIRESGRILYLMQRK